MLISGFGYAVLAALGKWGDKIGFSSAMVLFYRATFFIFFSLLSAIIELKFQSDTSKKCCMHIKFNFNKMIDEVKYMNVSKSKCEPIIQQTYNDKAAINLVNTKTNEHDISNAKLWLAIISRGIFGAMSGFTMFESADLIPLGSANTLTSLSCITAAFFGWILLKDEITRYHCIALILGLIGAVFISQPEFIFEGDNSGKSNDFGYVVALISAFTSGFVYLTIRIAEKAPAWLLIIWQATCCIFLSLSLIFIFDFGGTGFQWIEWNNWEQIICIFSIGIVGYIAEWTQTKGAQKLIAGVSSLVKSSTNLACSFILEMMIFKTYPNLYTIFGAIVALGAVILVSMEKIRKARREQEMDDIMSVDDGVYIKECFEDESMAKSVNKRQSFVSKVKPRDD